MNTTKQAICLILAVAMSAVSGISVAGCASPANESSRAASQAAGDSELAEATPKTETQNSINVSAQHMYIFDGDGERLPIAGDIDSFKDKLNAIYYGKDEESCFYAFFTPMHQYYWVYYDKDTRKVWKIVEYTDLISLTAEMGYDDFDYSDESISQLYREPKVLDYFKDRYTRDYGRDLEPYNSTLECINLDCGVVVFDMDEDLGPVAITVDKANSHDYENLEDAIYGLKASKLKIEDFYPAID